MGRFGPGTNGCAAGGSYGDLCVPAPLGNQYGLGNAGGRPTKYVEEYAEQARKLCKLGATDPDLAEFFKVHLSTIWEWSTRHEAFSDAIRIGKDQANDNVDRRLYMKACGYFINTEKVFCSQGEVTRVDTREYYPPDSTAIIWWQKNRRPDLWRERQDVNHSGSIDHQHKLTIDLVTSADDEVQREYAEALGAASQVQLLPPPAKG